MLQNDHRITHQKAARPLIMGRNGVVASGHPLATIAGLKILQAGGTAVDAALATAVCLAVVKPEACGVGGDVFALLHLAKQGDVKALNASGPAPGRATIEYFEKSGHALVPTGGPLSIAVPGAVDGWLELHRRFATMPLADLFADAIRLAREGFPLDLDLARSIRGSQSVDVGRSYRDSLPSLAPGELLRQAELATTLEILAEAGRDVFYGGELGKRMCAAIQEKGGLLCAEDLKGSFAQWLEPLSSGYRGYQLYEQPPVSQGFLLCEIMNLLDGYRSEEMDPVQWTHLMIEAKKIAFEDRISHLEDPSFGDPDVHRLISKGHADLRRKEITDTARPVNAPLPRTGSDTTYLCCADAEGNVVSLIESVFAQFGSGVVADGTGIVMNNRLCGFGLDPAKPNALRPGKKPAHTLNSYMVFQGNDFLAVGGTPGADDQPQTNAQVLHNLLDKKMDPQSALEAARWSHRPGAHPNSFGPERLLIEDGFSAQIVAGLEKRGHPVDLVDRWSFGGAALIIRDPATKTWMAAADPRRQTYALGW